MTTNPFRADVIGSMLRPPELLDARDRHQRGELSDAGLKVAEDDAVAFCIAIQERSGVDVVADGEMRRNVFASQLAQACDGFATVSGNTVDWYTMDGRIETSPVTVACVAPLKRRRHLSAEEFVYLRATAMKPTKITIPSSTMYAYYWLPGVSEAAYPSASAYLAAVTDILRDEVAELVRLGALYIQIDAPEFGMLIDPRQRDWFAAKGFDPDRLLDEGVDLINAVVAGQPAVTFGLHVCRGNDANRYMARGGYEAIARAVFPRANVQRLLLEYDDERSGDFAPLRHVPDDRIVVLGLISTKRPALEDPAELRARIADASRYIPLDRLALSPQCGFASVAKGNTLSFQAQEAKLRLVAGVAGEVWSDR